MEMNVLVAILITVAIAIGIVFLCALFKGNSKIKGIVDILTDAIPGLTDTIENILTVVKPEALDKFQQVENLVITAVRAVEQISQNTNMTSAEKKELAIQYYFELADDLNLPELSDLQIRTLEIIIENVVMSMNKDKIA